MKNLLSLLIVSLLFSAAGFSQDNNIGYPVEQSLRNCATMEVFDRLVTEDPSYMDRIGQIENDIRNFIDKNKGINDNLIITIPVVVHVVYRTTAENISTSQVLTQIDVLNQDFQALNPDISQVPPAFQPYVANSQITFCLASRDPSGNSTSGITRTKTKKVSFRTNDDVKFTSKGGENAWPSDRYLNIWVCNLSRGLLGYAQFPGGPSASDGIVVSYRAFGTIGTATYPFDKGRTATHEIGHWLNLRHIWGDDGGSCSGSDLVDDTPNQGAENYRCPAFPHISCANGPNGDMFMDYMDYTDDRCMFMFSIGQSGRMNAVLNGIRSTILTSNGCVPVNAPILTDKLNNNTDAREFQLKQNYPNPFNPATVINYSIKENGLVQLKIYSINGEEVAVLVNNYLQPGSYSVNFDGSNLSSGVYIYELSSGNLKITKKMALIK